MAQPVMTKNRNANKLTIKRLNIDQYRRDSYPDITVIRWKAGQLDPTVLASFPNLQELDCSHNKLDTLAGIEVCNRLTKLECSHNRLSSLESIRPCTTLRTLYCADNLLTTLQGIEVCTDLQLVALQYNSISSLAGIRACTNLEILFCWGNRLTSLEGLGGCPNLDTLECNNNLLTSLEGIERCTRLLKLDCSHNQITRLDPLAALTRLRHTDYDGNPLNIQTVRVQRFINQVTYTNFKRSIYDNSQNTHDMQVQSSVCASVQNLLLDPVPGCPSEYITESGLDVETVKKLRQFCGCTLVHSDYRLSYGQLLSYVFQRINNSEHRAEMLTIVPELVAASEGICFTGRFNQLLSVLVGFYDDITIGISDKARISAIVLAINARVEAQSKLKGGKPYDPRVHRLQAQQELFEAGYVKEDIEPWLDAIHEEKAEGTVE